MLLIYEIPEVIDILNSKRYNLEYLMKKSHIQLLRALFELQEVMMNYEKMVQVRLLKENRK